MTTNPAVFRALCERLGRKNNGPNVAENVAFAPEEFFRNDFRMVLRVELTNQHLEVQPSKWVQRLSFVNRAGLQGLCIQLLSTEDCLLDLVPDVRGKILFNRCVAGR